MVLTLEPSGNAISGNTFGLGSGGAALPNGGQGVLIAAGIGNAISQNSISSNGALGINLAPPDGINANDLDDPDTGSNALQNFPVLSSATCGASTTVVGSLNSRPRTRTASSSSPARPATERMAKAHASSAEECDDQLRRRRVV